MICKFLPNEKATPPGKLCDVELVFEQGEPLAGLKLVGCAIWTRKDGTHLNVTWPARAYTIAGERRSFALLRPIIDATAQDALRDTIIAAWHEHESKRVLCGRVDD